MSGRKVNRGKFLEPKVCPCCQNEFKPKKRRQEFCGRRCSGLARHGKTIDDLSQAASDVKPAPPAKK